jgi:hypothetical protein
MNCKNEPFNKPVNNQVINYLLSDPILTDAAQEYSSYLVRYFSYFSYFDFKIFSNLDIY